jgi:hypothetical protein
MAARKKQTKRQGSRTRRPGSAKPTRRKAAKGSVGGKPKVEFDLDELEKLARVGCTNQTMAAILDVGKATLQRRIADTPAVQAAIANGRATMERGLRQAQLATALRGNATMQIWLGKQVLGQRDVRAVEVSGVDGAPLELGVDLRPVLMEKLARLIQSRALE